MMAYRYSNEPIVSFVFLSSNGLLLVSLMSLSDYHYAIAQLVFVSSIYGNLFMPF